MIDELRELLSAQDTLRILNAGLPLAFQTVEVEHRQIGSNKLGMEVGKARENVVIGLLKLHLGADKLHLPGEGQSQKDVLIGDRRLGLEIKTVTGNGPIKVKWTVDNESVTKAIDNFDFHADFLIFRIFWNENQDSVFYLPQEALKDVVAEWPGQTYLNIRTGTNNRGIEFDREFLDKAAEHPLSLRLKIDWKRQDDSKIIHPIDRWVSYWSEQKAE